MLVALYEPILKTVDPRTLGKDAKTLLQEHLQGKKLPLPMYSVVATHGAAHSQVFEVECAIPKLQIHVLGSGASRRAAEQAAARGALEAAQAKASARRARKRASAAPSQQDGADGADDAVQRDGLDASAPRNGADPAPSHDAAGNPAPLQDTAAGDALEAQRVHAA